MNRLDLVVGPNGAGKSTFVELTLAPLLPGSVFVNADEIARRRWPDDPAGHCLRRRTGGGRHQAQADRARPVVHRGDGVLPPVQARADRCGTGRRLHRGRPCSCFPEELAVERVRHRVSAGGHDVPEGKIRERYQRLWALVAAAILRSDSATIYDNSTLKGPRIVAQFGGGFATGLSAWPEWTPKELSTRW